MCVYVCVCDCVCVCVCVFGSHNSEYQLNGYIKAPIPCPSVLNPFQAYYVVYTIVYDIMVVLFYFTGLCALAGFCHYSRS